MIDDIVEMVLIEARRRKGFSLISKINSVSNEVSLKLIDIMDNIPVQERGKREDENKT